MTHPEELFAEYVDGTLPEGARAVVSAHLETCARCRADVAVATSARTALRATPEPGVPAGLADAALEEAAREVADRAPNVRSIDAAGTPRWYRLLAGAGVAAAIVLAGALILPGIGEDGDRVGFGPVGSAVDGGTQEDAAAPAPASGVETFPGEVSDEEVLSAAEELFAGVPAAPNAAGDGEGVTSLSVSRVQDCLAHAFPDLEGKRAARLWRAHYRGEEAYLGFYVESPGADLPADFVRVRIASVKGCSVVGSTVIDP